jgi:hypothetical protein
MPKLAQIVLRVCSVILLAASAVFFLLHYVHLTADFPNFSPWMDWAKYTDEGWYGDAAIRHFELGHWYVPGDFNPAAALPVWPLVEALVFRFTGVSLIAARALTVTVFGGILAGSYLLLRRWSENKRTTLAPETGVLLLAASPFCFVFTRLAILEPLLVLLTLAALLVVGTVRPVPGEDRPAEINAEGWMARLWSEIRVNLARIAGLGVLLPALVLTKTTGVFLIPCIAFLLLAAVDYRMKAFLRVGVPGATLGGLLWLAYFGLIVRPHYLLDYRYLFAANAYTGITLATAGAVLTKTFQDGAWMGRGVYGCAVGCVAIAIGSIGRLRRHPLIPALLLWALGYAAFLAYHDNLQPRYYLVIAVPLTLLVPATVEQLVLSRISSARVRWGVFVTTGLVVAAIAIGEGHRTLTYVRHPQYTLVDAARKVRAVIAADRKQNPGHSPLVLSISGSELSLMNGLPSICDDFGTLELVDRVRRYRPGWYVAWNAIEDDKMDALRPFYHVERVAAFPAMDDPDRNLLIVYRLDDALQTRPGNLHGKPLPKRLKTKLGQQPSVEQLQH